MSRSLHPRDVLFQGARRLPLIPACDHYAGSEKLIRKAFTLQAELNGAFDVTCDCEDGAPAGKEQEHAQLIVDLLRSSDNRCKRTGVRTHDAASAFFKSEVSLFTAAVGAELSYITLPKAQSAEQVRFAAAFIKEQCAANNLQRTIPLHVLIETPQALAEASQIAALDEVETLDFGLLDFISEHMGALSSECMKSPAQFTHRLIVRAKSEIAAAALRYGKIPVHNITLELKNREQTFADAQRAREEFGFLRMWSIHPAQIEPILRAMSPAPADIARAERILLRARAAAWAPIAHEGELHDRASYRYFWDMLERAQLAGAQLSESTVAAFFR